MDKEYLVAVASSDGIVVNTHFGKGKDFYIYSVNEKEEIKLVEKRSVVPVCHGGDHDEERFVENLKRFSDCRYILVSRVGMAAANMAEQLGIQVMMLPGVIEESIRKLITYEKVQNLFVKCS